MKKILKRAGILIISLFILNNSLFAESKVLEYICEIGINFYNQGRYYDALQEFKKALVVDPEYKPAIKYIQMAEEALRASEAKAELIPEDYKSEAATKKEVVDEFLNLVELQKDTFGLKQGEYGTQEARTPKVESLILGQDSIDPDKSIDIAIGDGIVIKGNNIKRFLLTTPNILKVERKSADELVVTGDEVGSTYMHIWDDNGRWTVSFMGILPRPMGLSYEQYFLEEEERAKNFKLRYSVDWSSFETGRRLNKVSQSGSYSWVHGIGLSGQTPYGHLDTSATVRRLKTTTDMTYAGFSLTDGQFGDFKGFSLHGGDYSPPFSNLSFPGTSLRGAMFISPAFNKKVEYNVFWGRENAGRFPNLSPELTKTKHSFVSGSSISLSPTDKQNYNFSVFHGWGRDRDDFLNRYGYDLNSRWNFDRWGMGYEVASDSETFAHLFDTRLFIPNLSLTTELRNIDKDFVSITGTGWRQGELGSLINLNYRPSDKTTITSRLDVYRDRLFPAEDNIDRLNQDFDLGVSHQIDSLSNIDFGYSLQNDVGKLSQSRYQSPSINYSRRFDFIREVNTYASYSYQKNQSYSAPSLDYSNNRIDLGIRFNLIGPLYYYFNRQLNWLEDEYADSRSRPNVMEMGLDWANQIGKTPFYSNIRFTYRDEEDTESNLSFLSGEDYIEGYSELTYRKDNDTEVYGSCRIRNSWADNPNITKKIDATFNAGMRYVWDTGVRWDAVCDIEGYVFKDLNSDGLRQRDEAPVEGMQIWLGKTQKQTTDVFGYYKFKGVKGVKAYINFDMSKLPAGFLLTVPRTQEIAIVNHRTIRVDFGIISRSEISGVVFEDANSNGRPDGGEKGIEGVVVSLEDGKTVKTDIEGKYAFSNASAGEHTISIKLESIPIYYLPKAALTKKITLFEGVTYIYNIPLERTKE